MKARFLFVLAGFVLFTVRPGVSANPSSFTIGTSASGSSVYIMSVGMAEILYKKTGLNLTNEPVGSSDACIRSMRARKTDLAMATSSSIANAYSGTKQYAKEGRSSIRVLLQGQESVRHIIFRTDSGVKTPSDLRGKKFIGKRPSAADMEQITNALLKAYAIPKESLKILQVAEGNEALEALKIGTADGAIILAGVGASNVVELARTTNVMFLPIPEEKLDQMQSDLGPAFHKVTIPANTYKGQSQEVRFLSLPMVMSVISDFPEEAAYKITKTLLESQKELAAIHSVGKEWTVSSALHPPPAPFHPGAIRYFKEKGIWSLKLEKEQEKLLNQK